MHTTASAQDPLHRQKTSDWNQVRVFLSGSHTALLSGGWQYRMLDQPSKQRDSKAISSSDRIRHCPSKGVRSLNNAVP